MHLYKQLLIWLYIHLRLRKCPEPFPRGRYHCDPNFLDFWCVGLLLKDGHRTWPGSKLQFWSSHISLDVRFISSFFLHVRAWTAGIQQLIILCPGTAKEGIILQSPSHKELGITETRMSLGRCFITPARHNRWTLWTSKEKWWSQPGKKKKNLGPEHAPDALEVKAKENTAIKKPTRWLGVSSLEKRLRGDSSPQFSCWGAALISALCDPEKV